MKIEIRLHSCQTVNKGTRIGRMGALRILENHFPGKGLKLLSESAREVKTTGKPVTVLLPNTSVLKFEIVEGVIVSHEIYKPAQAVLGYVELRKFEILYKLEGYWTKETRLNFQGGLLCEPKTQNFPNLKRAQDSMYYKMGRLFDQGWE